MPACLVSTLTNSYVPGACAFLRSLLLHHKKLNLDYVILEVEPISTNNKIKLLQIYPKLFFKPIIHDDYQYNSLSTTWRAWEYNVFNRFDMFLLEEYSRLYFFDVDCIVLKSLDDYFQLKSDFIAVPTITTSGIDHAVRQPFDAGVMSISKKFITQKVRLELIELSQSKEWSSDEPVLNQYFASDVTHAEYRYNTLTSNLTVPLLKAASIVQFVGEKKPWVKGKTKNDIYDQYVLDTSSRAALALAQTAFNNFHDCH